LWRSRPTHAFVHGRQTQQLWINHGQSLLGFHNLRFIWQATRSPDAQPEPTWFAEFKQDSA
jgi:hypothetical protein